MMAYLAELRLFAMCMLAMLVVVSSAPTVTVSDGVPGCSSSSCVFTHINLTEGQCGQIDAASSIPPSLFLTQNAPVLNEYIQATELFWFGPSGEQGLSLSTCPSVGYPRKIKSIEIQWPLNSREMYVLCANCKCSYPACPDHPPAGLPSYCSVCGPTLNKPRLVDIYGRLSPPSPPPPPFPPNINCTKESCIFAHVNYTEQRCGLVNAAPSMPPSLFEPQYAPQLQEYIEVTINEYKGPGGEVGMYGGVTCESLGYRYKHQSAPGAYVKWALPDAVMRTACYACGCVYPACPDKPDTGIFEYCSVCGPTANKERYIEFFFQVPDGPPPPPPFPPSPPSPPSPSELCTKNGCNFIHLNFTQQRCGQVDAAPSMPDSLFEPQNVKLLEEYIETTENYWGGNVYGYKPIGLGTCASRGYTYRHGANIGEYIKWALPESEMLALCLSCGCVFGSCPDQPSAGQPPYCNVCGPTANKDRYVSFYYRSPE